LEIKLKKGYTNRKTRNNSSYTQKRKEKKIHMGDVAPYKEKAVMNCVA